MHHQDIGEALEQYATWSGRAFAEATLGYYASLVDAMERVSGDVEQVTGHPARSFARWSADHREDFAPSTADGA